jgi:transcriptional regulator with XRE-family HTH domain
MEKEILGDKIKTLRNGKGYSQEHLSGLAQLSLRTIQRIENGETEARGDTLNRLAKALEVSIDELIGSQFSTSNDGYLALMNLSGLACLFMYIPFLGVLLPLMLWLLKKDTLPNIKEQGKKILNFQFTLHLSFVLWVIAVILFAGGIGHSLSPYLALGMPELILMSVAIFPLFNTIMIIINTVRILQHKEMKYWPAYRFLK